MKKVYAVGYCFCLCATLIGMHNDNQKKEPLTSGPHYWTIKDVFITHAGELCRNDVELIIAKAQHNDPSIKLTQKGCDILKKADVLDTNEQFKSERISLVVMLLLTEHAEIKALIKDGRK